jgi:hypothetical protein
MKYQIGLYRNREQPLDQWDALIDLQDPRSARDLLRDLTPFLREYHCAHGMEDTQGLAAWLAWYLIEAHLASGQDFSGIALGSELRGDIDFFYRLSPGLLEVYRLDELLEWHPVARAEIRCAPVEVGTHPVIDLADGDP